MFDTLHRGGLGRTLASLLGSFIVHALFVLVAIRAFAPAFVKVSPVRNGERGTSITLLYWPARPSAPAAAMADDGSPARSTPIAGHQLTFQRAWQSRNTARGHQANAEVSSPNDSTPAQPLQARIAGSPYGSLTDGSLTGAEVRPAIRVSGPNPAWSPEDLPSGLQGSVIVEVTIDEQGNVRSAVLVQSLIPALDAKVISAVQTWHFLPATRDGIAIPSKQDVLYHFPR
jgi:TonB family protein